MTELKITHILILVFVAFVLYHLIGGCSCGMCSRDGFSVGAYSPKAGKTDYGYSLYCKGGSSFGMYDSICPGWHKQQNFNRFKSEQDAINARNLFNCVKAKSIFDDDKCDYKPPPPPAPDLIKLEPNDRNAESFLNRLKNAYNDNKSNGVFVSMFIDEKMDGSGSIINKYLPLVFGNMCDFGLIWDTDWMDVKEGQEQSLLDCLFPTGAQTTPFKSCTNAKTGNINFCTIANTSKDNMPDRCSTGLNYYRASTEILNVTNCNQNILYDFELPYKKKLPNDENCFKYLVRTGEIHNLSYNEGVFFNDIDDNGIEINNGLNKLKQLKKPKPVALFFLHDDKKNCQRQSLKYLNTIDLLKKTFTPDTLVISRNLINIYPGISFNAVTLNDIPGYLN
jgi:hypothetical protein